MPSRNVDSQCRVDSNGSHPAGAAPPWDINVVVEIPVRGDGPFCSSAYQPGNYGFVPRTAMAISTALRM